MASPFISYLRHISWTIEQQCCCIVSFCTAFCGEGISFAINNLQETPKTKLYCIDDICTNLAFFKTKFRIGIIFFFFFNCFWIKWWMFMFILIEGWLISWFLSFFFCGVTLTIVGSESKAASATSWPLFVFWLTCTPCTITSSATWIYEALCAVAEHRWP